MKYYKHLNNKLTRRKMLAISYKLEDKFKKLLKLPVKWMYKI